MSEATAISSPSLVETQHAASSKCAATSLPLGWTTTDLLQVCDINPRAFTREPKQEDMVSFVPMASVQAESGKLDASRIRPWREVRKGFTRFEESDVLFAKITPCMENGKYAIARDLHNGIGAGSTEFHVFRSSAALSPNFLLHWLFQRQLRQAARMSMKGAAGQLRVPELFFQILRIDLPPRSEQDRIVAEIEKQFTRLDDAVAALKRVQANLKRYRASVLKAACEGRLVPTEAELARKGGRDYEPASELLKRILAERRAKWEADQLAKLVAAGKPPKDNEWKRRYKEPEPPDIGNLPELPEGWIWATWDQLSNWVTYGFTRPMPHVSDGIPIVTARHIRNGKIDFENCDLTTNEDFESLNAKDKPQQGDLLLTKDGTIGRCAVVPDARFCINQSVAVVWMRSCIADRYFLRYVIESEIIQRPIWAKARGVAIQHLSITDFAKLPCPLAPLNEQARIVEYLNSRLSFCEHMDKTSRQTFARATRARASILQRAFSGKLVPQDPNDEPATGMLERVGVERDQRLATRNEEQRTGASKRKRQRVQKRDRSIPEKWKVKESRQRWRGRG